MSFFDYFEIFAIALMTAFVIGKAAYLQGVRRTNPIVIGRAKGVATFLFELLATAGLLTWMTEIVLRALHSRSDLFSAALRYALIDMRPVKFLGVLLVSAGLILFGLALLTFGDSWRIGIDEK